MSIQKIFFGGSYTLTIHYYFNPDQGENITIILKL